MATDLFSLIFFSDGATISSIKSNSSISFVLHNVSIVLSVTLDDSGYCVILINESI